MSGVRATSIRCDRTGAGLRRSDATTKPPQFAAKRKSWMTGRWFSSRTRCLAPKPGAIRRGATHNSILGSTSELIWSPRQLESARLIVARRVSTPRAAGKFDLYSFDFIHGRFQAPIYRDSELSSIEAVPVAAHPAPRWYWSTLRPENKVGYFICLDASMSDDAPKGRLSPLPTGVRVLALDPAT